MGRYRTAGIRRQLGNLQRAMGRNDGEIRIVQTVTIDTESADAMYFDTVGIGTETHPYGFKSGTSMACPALADKVSTGGIIDLSVDEYAAGPAEQPAPDITDETVSGKEETVTGSGSESSAGISGNDQSGASGETVSAGDESRTGLWVTAVILAVLGLVVITVIRRRKS